MFWVILQILLSGKRKMSAGKFTRETAAKAF